MEKLKMSTPDLTDMNIEKIGALFPNVITEIRDENGEVKKAIDFDLLKQVLSKSIVEDDNERYRLDWPGKKASLLKSNIPITKTLRPCREESVNFDTTENLYIEGDNFEVLKILQESYLGKIKMIYIDPPYNTGNDFIYRDNYTKSKEEYEEELGTTDEAGAKLFRNTDISGRYHSDWLSMMYERLLVARDLLRDDGVIFISIDDNEAHNLRKICDEVFGEKNHLVNYYIQVRYEGKTLVEKNDYQKLMEQVLAYAKSDRFIPVRPTEEYSIKKFCWNIVEKGKGRKEIIRGKTVTIFTPDEYEIIKVKPSLDALKETWATGTILTGNASGKFFGEFLAPRKEVDGLNILYKVNDIGEDGLGYRYFTGPKRESATKGKFYSGIPQSRMDDFTDGGASIKLKSIPNYYNFSGDFGNCRHEGGVDFRAGKKPLKLLKMLIEQTISSQDDTIMDFFSGSATTAHAVMNLNAEDGGDRKFIMIQLPEPTDENSDTYQAGYKTIAEIGKERIRRAGNKLVEELKEKTKQLELGEEPVDYNKLDIGFRVYKTDTSNMKDVFYHPSELDQKMLSNLESNIKADRTPEDLLTQVILDLGLELTLPIETKLLFGNTVYFVQTNALIACFDENIDFSIVDEISSYKPFRVVFRDASFIDDKDRINVEERFKRLSPETKVTVI